jgi:hypothetical protein
MEKLIDQIRKLCGGLAVSFALPFFCSIAPHAEAQGQSGVPVSTITAISVERGCFGCATGSILVVRRDGTATYTITGNARQGTEDKSSTGRVRVEEFEKLARFLVAQGFFEMKEQYDDPKIRDGAWTTTSVLRGAQDTRVFRRDSAGPAALIAVEKAIDALKARIEFVPKIP